MVLPRRWSARFVRSEQLSVATRLLTFEPRGDGALRWRPGQYVALHREREPDVRAFYSIACAQEVAPDGCFELAVSTISQSGVLENLTVASELVVEGPRGSFARDGDRQTPALFVGSGTGIAPLRAMIQSALWHAQQSTAAAPLPMTLLFGCRGEDEMLFADEFSTAERAGRLRYEPTLSQAPIGWRGRRGYVQEHLKELLQATPDAEVYVCGSEEMVDDTTTALAELGVPTARVFSERQ